jgi:hypothetical protein
MSFNFFPWPEVRWYICMIGEKSSTCITRKKTPNRSLYLFNLKLHISYLFTSSLFFIPEMGGLQDMVAPPLQQLIPKSCRFSTVTPENHVYCDLSHDSWEGHNVDGEFELENNLKIGLANYTTPTGSRRGVLNQSYTPRERFRRPAPRTRSNLGIIAFLKPSESSI